MPYRPSKRKQYQALELEKEFAPPYPEGWYLTTSGYASKLHKRVENSLVARCSRILSFSRTTSEANKNAKFKKCKKCLGL